MERNQNLEVLFCRKSQREGMRSNRQTILLLLTAICFLIVGIITFRYINPTKTSTPLPQKTLTDYQQPTPQPTYFKQVTQSKKTTEWSTFTDEANNITIKYPEDIIIDARQTVKGLQTVLSSQPHSPAQK